MKTRDIAQNVDINIFVSHAFSPRLTGFDAESFRSEVSNIIKAAGEAVSLCTSVFSANLIIEMPDRTRSLPLQIRESLERAQIGIVEISDNNPNVMYEYGFLRALGTPCIVLKSNGSLAADVPVDVQGDFITFYSNLTDLSSLIIEDCKRLLSEAVLNRPIVQKVVSQVWFDRDVDHISIVSSSEHTKSAFAERCSPDYVFLDNIGDRDSVLECCMFLARNYPKANITIHASDQFDYRYISHNLVVIGGPGDGTEGNAVCASIMEKIASNCRYTDDDRLAVGKKAYAAEMNALHGITKDFGYFARMPNPFDNSKSVVMMHGIHTFGVLGAARAFIDNLAGVANVSIALGRAMRHPVGQYAFECFFEVEVFPSGAIGVPKVEAQKVFPLKRVT